MGPLILFLALFALQTLSQSCVNLPCSANGLSATIDSGTHEFTLTLEGFPSPLPFTNFVLTTEITHSFCEKLVITLISPAGTPVVVVRRLGGNLKDLYASTQWMEGAPWVSKFGFWENGPMSPLAPMEAFSAFAGEDPNGQWTLVVSNEDGGRGEKGIISGWALSFDSDNPGVQCLNGGVPIEGPGPLQCDCSGTNFLGAYCQYRNACALEPCNNGGICSQPAASYSCDCSGTAHAGTNCQIYGFESPVEDPCLNGGVLWDFMGTGYSACDCFYTYFVGVYCEVSIYCDLHPQEACMNGGRCIPDQYLGYTCDCNGTNHFDDICATTLCVMKDCGPGVCQEDSLMCSCSGTGFEGPACEENINDCPATNPCQNGGVCQDGISSYSCNCSDTGFGGPTCEENINDCPARNPCKNGGQCVDGINSYSCNCSGTGFAGTRCTFKVNCTATQQIEGNASWSKASTPAGGYAWGSCQPGFVGKPYRQCGLDGIFGVIHDPCTSADVECPANFYANANWTATKVTTIASGICLPGFSGAPKRQCKNDGKWATNVSQHCKRLNCTALTASQAEGNAVWPEAKPSTKATGVCLPGFIGKPTRFCGSIAQWQRVSDPCRPTGKCKSETYARAVWPETEPGTRATGSCISAWTGAPLRRCKPDGTWQTFVEDHCQRS